MTDRHVGAGQTYSTIQSAVNVAVAGDNIIVHAGTYSEGQILIRDKHGTSTSWITLQPYGTDVVTIDGANVPHTSWGYSTIMIRKCDYIRITGLNIINNAAWGVKIWNNGEAAGTTTSNIRVDHCYIFNSSGMAVNATPESIGTVTYITVDHNIVDLANCNWAWEETDNYIYGFGGEAISIANVQHFEVAYNTVSRCGKECTDMKSGSKYGSFHHNTVDTSTWVGEPGYNPANGGIPDGTLYGHIGIYCDSFSRTNDGIDIYNNLVYGNHGPGIVIGVEETTGELHNVNIYNNIVNLNWESAYGIGIMTWSGAAEPETNIHIYNNTVKTTDHCSLLVGSKAGSLSNVVIENNIFSSESAYTLVRFDYYNYTDSSITLRNNLYRRYGSTSRICWMYHVSQACYTTTGAWWGTNAIFGQDPLFVDRANGNFHLQPSSPAINTGATVDLDFDYDDNPRPIGSYDIGAYEYSIYHPPGQIDDTESFTVNVQ